MFVYMTLFQDPITQKGSPHLPFHPDSSLAPYIAQVLPDYLSIRFSVLVLTAFILAGVFTGFAGVFAGIAGVLTRVLARVLAGVLAGVLARIVTRVLIFLELVLDVIHDHVVHLRNLTGNGLADARSLHGAVERDVVEADVAAEVAHGVADVGAPLPAVIALDLVAEVLVVLVHVESAQTFPGEAALGLGRLGRLAAVVIVVVVVAEFVVPM